MVLSELGEILSEGELLWQTAEAVPLKVLERLDGGRDADEAAAAGSREGEPWGNNSASREAAQEDEEDGLRNDVLALPGASCIALADNLGFMKTCAGDGLAGAFNLIYIDPPFFSKKDYGAEIRLKSLKGEAFPALKRETYDDAWFGGISQYLRMLAPRLFGIKELLADTGCFWIHLDWHAVHYVKVLLDAIFGTENFVNEVIWNYKSGGVSQRRFARKHDTLLFYSKSPRYYFKPQKEKSYNRALKPYRFKGVKEYKDDTGWYTLVNMKDVWQLDMVGRTSRERTGYTTQKPESLILRIMESCTKEGDLCGDFFGGSGTMAAAAERMGRRWFLCDKGKLAIINSHKRMAELGARFQIAADARLQENALGRFEIELNVENALEPGKKRLAVKLLKYAFPDSAQLLPAEERHGGAINEILENDSLQLVEYWSVDADYDGESYEPIMWKAKSGGRVDENADFTVDHVRTVAVRVIDVFGQSSFRVFQTW